MKITLFNSFPNKVIPELTESINKEYFSDLDEAVGFFQSNEIFTLNKGKYAIMIPYEDVIVTSKLYPFLQSLRHIKAGKKHIVCFQKDVHENPDLRRILLHELRHIEQFSKFPTEFYRSQLIGVLFNDKWATPTEKDADSFAHSPANKKHLWIKDVKTIIEDFTEEFKCLYSDLQLQKKGKSPVGYIKFLDGLCTLTTANSDSELDYYLHIFIKAKII